MNERLKLIREDSGLSTREFSSRLGMSNGAISLLESGKRNMTSQFINALCKEFNIDENWLRTGEGEMIAVKNRDQEIAEIVAQMFNGDETGYRFQLQKLISECDEKALEVLYNFAKNWVDNVNNAKEKELPED